MRGVQDTLWCLFSTFSCLFVCCCFFQGRWSGPQKCIQSSPQECQSIFISSTERRQCGQVYYWECSKWNISTKLPELLTSRDVKSGYFCHREQRPRPPPPPSLSQSTAHFPPLAQSPPSTPEKERTHPPSLNVFFFFCFFFREIEMQQCIKKLWNEIEIRRYILDLCNGAKSLKLKKFQSVFYEGDLLTRTVDRDIPSILRRLQNYPGELACMSYNVTSISSQRN